MYCRVIIMEAITEFAAHLPTYISAILAVLIRVFAVLFVFFITKYRNGNHKPVYYILVIFFPLIGVIVFAVDRKTMNGVGMNRCPSCGCLYPPEFKTCYKCNIELPQYNENRAKRFKSLALVMVVLFGVSYFANEFIALTNFLHEAKDFFNEETAYCRIGFTDENGNKVYYDRNGEVYTDPDDVAIYTKDGKKYVYSAAIDRYSCSDGSTMSNYSAYVDSDGYIIEDKNESIYFNPAYQVTESEDEAKDDGKTVSFLSPETDEYDDDFGDWACVDYDKPYYMSPYSDDDGNLYYDAEVASWTKDGKLITSDADCQ